MNSESLRLTDATHRADGAQDDRVADECGRGPGHLVEAVPGEQLERGSGGNNEGGASLIRDENIPIIGAGRRLEASGAGQRLLIDRRASFRVEAVQHATVVRRKSVKPALQHKRGGEVRPSVVSEPGDTRIRFLAGSKRDVAGGAGFNGPHWPKFLTGGLRTHPEVEHFVSRHRRRFATTGSRPVAFALALGSARA